MSGRAITIKAIQVAAAGRYGVSFIDLVSFRRDAHLARARMIAMTLCFRLTEHSSTVIARAFGGRDHTTALNARDTIARRCANDLALAGEIDRLEDRLRRAAVEGVCGLGLGRAAELDAALNQLGLELAIVPIGTRDANGFAKRTGGSK